MSAPAPRPVRRGALFTVALAALAAVVIAAIVLLPRAEPAAVAPTPAPTATQPSPTPSPTASPTATPAPSPSPTAASGRYVNAELGYSIDLASPWHRADCGSFKLTDFGGGERHARDEFIPIPDSDFRPSGTGSAVDTIHVFARANPQRLTPRAWEQAGKIGFSMGRVLEDVTFAGRPALRLGGSAEAELFVVADNEFMIEVGQEGGRGQSAASTRAAIVRTFRFLTADELRAARAVPTPAPPAARSPEQTADALADGFARRDPVVLRNVLTPGCVSLGVANGGGTGVDDATYLEELRARFARGLTVTVQARPLTGDRGGTLPTLHTRSTWREPGQPDQDVDLMISPEGPTWYWRGNVTYPPGRR
jgi:hypothetical protein